MIIPDINLLLYAYNEESPFHDAARQWWGRTQSTELNLLASLGWCQLGS